MPRRCSVATRERLTASCFGFPSPDARIIFTRLASSSCLCSFVVAEAARPLSSYRGRYVARLGKHIVSCARETRCGRCTFTDCTDCTLTYRKVSSTSSSDGSCCRFTATRLRYTRCGLVRLYSLAHEDIACTRKRLLRQGFRGASGRTWRIRG